MTTPAAIQAALLWDLPRLQRESGYGAQAFVNALELRPAPTHDPEASSVEHVPLAVAAQGIAAELSGHPSEAARFYESLRASGAYWTSVLGDFLLCWSTGAASESRYAALAKRLRKTRDSSLRSRLLWKLITWAVDRGYSELLESLVRQWLDSVPARTRLSDVGFSEISNLGLGHLLPRGWPPTPEPEGDEDTSLIDYSWIVWPAFDVARASDVDRFAARARQAAVATIRIGPARGSRLFALHLQAEWAGAFWLLRPLRQQLASHVLGSEAPADAQVGYACVMWVAGGGSDTRSVLDFAESRFGPETADYVIQQVSKAYRPPFFGDHQLAETILALWDEVGSELAVGLVRGMEVAGGDHPNQSLGRRAFLSLGIRATDAWAIRYDELSDEVRDEVARDTPWLDISLLPEAMIAELTRDDRVSRFMDEPSDASRVAAIALATRSDATTAAMLVSRLSPTAVARVAAVRPDLVHEDVARRAAAALEEVLARQLQEARAGRYGMTSDDLYGDAARLLLRLQAIDDSWRRLIEALALTPGVPLEMRLGGLRVATELVLQRKFDRELAEVLAHASEEGPSLWNAVSPDVIRAQKLLLRLSSERTFTPATAAELFVASRHPDPQVRNVPLLAIHYLGSTGGEDVVDAILVGALYDEDGGVVRNALALLSEIEFGNAAARTTLHDRLRELYASGSREIRLAVVFPAMRMAHTDPGLARLVRDAAQDRSWLVRRAVEPSHSRTDEPSPTGEAAT
jgi:hypothetical protein